MVSRSKSITANLASLSAIVLSLSAGGCEQAQPASQEGVVSTTEGDLSTPASAHASTYMRQWMTNVAFTAKYDLSDPLLASRSYAYAAVTGYEAVVHGMPGYQSLAGQVNGLDSLPQPEPGAEYDWPTVLAAAMGRAVPQFYVFPNTLFFEYT